jgi:hypothetical protein
MTKKTGISELFNLCIEESNQVPDFINIRLKEHKLPYNTISTLIAELIYLIKPIFMKEKDIFKFLIDFEVMAANGFEPITSPILYLECLQYVEDIIDNLISEAENLQEYEAENNLHIFKKLRNEYQHRDYFKD